MRRILIWAFLATTGFSLFSAAPAPLPQRSDTPAQGQAPMQMDSDCYQLTPAEQNFSYQIMDPSNRKAFCSDFSSEQRQQAMQLEGQADSSGNMMNADQAVQQVMRSGQMNPGTQSNPRSSRGGCPVNRSGTQPSQ